MGSLENRDRVLSRHRALLVIRAQQPQAECALPAPVYADGVNVMASILLEQLEGRLEIEHRLRMGAAQERFEASTVGGEVIALVAHEIGMPPLVPSPGEPSVSWQEHCFAEHNAGELRTCRATGSQSVLTDSPLEVRSHGVAVAVAEYLPGELDRHPRREGKEPEPGDGVMWRLQAEEEGLTRSESAEFVLSRRAPEVDLVNLGQLIGWPEVGEPAFIGGRDDGRQGRGGHGRWSLARRDLERSCWLRGRLFGARTDIPVVSVCDLGLGQLRGAAIMVPNGLSAMAADVPHGARRA